MGKQPMRLAEVEVRMLHVQGDRTAAVPIFAGAAWSNCRLSGPVVLAVASLQLEHSEHA